MPRLFVDSSQVRGGVATVEGPDAAHLAGSLRVRPGEVIVIVESGAVEHGLRVEEVGPSRVAGRIAWTRPATGEPHLEVHVLQALPQKGMDDAVAGLAEVGAAGIWPVLTARTVSRPDGLAAPGKVARWQRIARESAQLSGRAKAPEVHPMHTLAEACRLLPAETQLIACVADESSQPLRCASVDIDRPVALVVGPEGGLDPAELEMLRARRMTPVHLGPRVIPSRLAGSIAISLLLAQIGELDTAVTPPPR